MYEEGVNALVIAGTTGEASTLTDEEHKEVIAYSVNLGKYGNTKYITAAKTAGITHIIHLNNNDFFFISSPCYIFRTGRT